MISSDHPFSRDTGTSWEYKMKSFSNKQFAAGRVFPIRVCSLDDMSFEIVACMAVL